MWTRKRGLVLLNLILLVGFVCGSSKAKTSANGRRSKAFPRESEPASKNGRSRFQWFTSSRSDQKGADEKLTDKESNGSKDEDEPSKDGSSWWLRRQSKKDTKKKKSSDKPSKQEVKKKEEEEKKKAKESLQNPVTESPSATNTTTTTTATPGQTTRRPSPNTTTYMIMRSPQQQQQQVPAIYLGGAPPGTTGASPQMVPGGRPPLSTNVVLVSYAASLVSTLLRLWFLTSIAKWLGDEDTVKPTQHFVWELLNDFYSKDAGTLQTVVSTAPPGMSNRKWRRIQKRRGNRKPPKPAYSVEDTFKKTVLVIDFKPNKHKGGAMDFPHLQQVVTFILTQHRQHAFGTNMENNAPRDLEVVILVESPGGAVQDFGLAATQVGRLSTEKGISTTVCVDHVAASGGYMIASRANQLCAAPFSVLGSVGVIRESFNVHDFLERHGIQPLVLKAGDNKVPLTMFGQVTRTDLKVAQHQLDRFHDAFQQSVVEARPALADTFQAVCNGEVYLGTEAKELELVDRVVTSEEYLLERITAGDRVLKLHQRSHEHRFGKRQFSPLDLIVERTGGLRAFVKDFVSSGSATSLMSRMVHTGSILGFAQYLLRNRIL